MQNELSLLQANIEWLSEKVSLINTNIFTSFGIVVAVFGIVGIYFIKTTVNQKVNEELKKIINNTNPLCSIKLELNRMPGVVGFYENYAAKFDFKKYKIEQESDILNAYISKIYYPMYNTEILKETLDKQKKEIVDKRNEDTYLQYIQSKEMYKNNTIINQKGFKSIYSGFNIKFDFENNLIDVFLPPKETIMIDNYDKSYSRLYCEFQIINSKYKE